MSSMQYPIHSFSYQQQQSQQPQSVQQSLGGGEQRLPRIFGEEPSRSPTHMFKRSTQDNIPSNGHGVPSTETMAMQIQKLSSDVQHLHSAMREREEDESYYSKQAYEKLSRMHQLITNKERQLMDRIAAVQDQLGNVDCNGRENGERRIRLAEEKTEMVKQAFEKRAGMADMNVARERRERVEGEDRLRAEVRARFEQFTAALRDHEAFVKSYQGRATQDVQELQEEQRKNLQSIRDHFQDALVNVANRIKSVHGTIKQSESKVDTKIDQATKQLSDMLKAEIKVRKSALGKVVESLAQQEKIIQQEMTQLTASVHAKQDLHSCRLEEVDNTTRERHESFARETLASVVELRKDNRQLEQDLQAHVADFGTRIETVQSSLASAQKSITDDIEALSSQTAAGVQELRSDVFEKLGTLEDRMLRTMEERISKLERLLTNEQIDRHQHCQNVKNELTDQISQLRAYQAEQDHALRAELACTKENFDTLVQEKHTLLQNTLQSTSTTLQGHIDHLSASLDATIQEVDRTAREGLSSQAAAHSALQERVEHLSNESSASTEATRQEIRQLGKSLEQKITHANSRVDGVYGDVQREIDRATNKELELAGAIASARAILQKTITDATESLSSVLDAKLEQERTHSASYTDSKVSAARALLMTSIETESSTRCNENTELQESLRSEIKLSCDKIVQEAKANLDSTAKSLRAEVEGTERARTQSILHLTTLVEATAHSLRVDFGNAQDEMNVRSAMDMLCAKVERESAVARLDEQQQDQEILQDALRAEISARERDMAKLRSETQGSVDALTASQGEEIAKLQAAQAAARSQAAQEKTDLQSHIKGQNEELLRKITEQSEATGKLTMTFETKIEEVMSQLQDCTAYDQRLQSQIDQNYNELTAADQSTAQASQLEVDQKLQDIWAYSQESDSRREELRTYVEQLYTKMQSQEEDGQVLQSNMTQKMEELETKIRESSGESLQLVDQSIGELRDELLAAQGLLGSIQENVSALGIQVDNLEAAIPDSKALAEKSSAKQEELANKISEIQTKVQEQQPKLESIQGEIAKMRLSSNDGSSDTIEPDNQDFKMEVSKRLDNLEEALLLVGNEGLKTKNEIHKLEANAKDMENNVENLEEAVLLVGEEGLKAHSDIKHLEEDNKEDPNEAKK